MSASTEELLKAKETAAALLEQLGLVAYLFEVEPREEHWEVRVDCALDQGWQTSVLFVDKALLLSSPHDPGARERLLQEWGRHLASCKRRSG